MLNKLACAIIAFSFLSIILLFSGINPRPSNTVNEIPRPKLYSVEDMEARHADEHVFYMESESITPAIIEAIHSKPAVVAHSSQSIDPKQLKCLQENIFFESRNQNILGQAMVALVTLARTEHKRYPNTVCGVVFQRKQFSWTNRGHKKPNLKNPTEKRAWEIAGIIAEVFLKSDIDKIVNDVTHYHTDAVKPKWSKSSKLTPVLKIENHIFYSENT